MFLDHRCLRNCVSGPVIRLGPPTSPSIIRKRPTLPPIEGSAATTPELTAVLRGGKLNHVGSFTSLISCPVIEKLNTSLQRALQMISCYHQPNGRDCFVPFIKCDLHVEQTNLHSVFLFYFG